MFWIWMILEVVWTVCESSVESFLKSNEAVSPEIAKKRDYFLVTVVMSAILVFMIGYYRVEENPGLFSWGELAPSKLLNYGMMFSGLYEMIYSVIIGVPYMIKKYTPRTKTNTEVMSEPDKVVGQN